VALLVLVQPGALFGQQIALTVVGNHEGEHALEWHENQFVVTVRVAGVVAGMAVDLGNESQADGPPGTGGGDEGGIGDEYSVAAVLGWCTWKRSSPTPRRRMRQRSVTTSRNWPS
jgi:hypothetical protein